MDKKILLKLEQIYQTTIDNFRLQNKDDYEDVPDINSDKEYKTYHVFPPMSEDIEEPEIKTKKGKNVLREPADEDPEENKPLDIKMIDNKGKEIENWKTKDPVKEQKEPINNKEDDPNDMEKLSNANDNIPEQNPNIGVDPNSNQGTENPDPSQLTAGQQDPNQEETSTYWPSFTREEVGRVYELKKIYSRLLSIESQLSFTSNEILLKVRRYISDAIELFETVIYNLDVYKGNLDDIIVMFYDFLREIYEILKKYYIMREKQREENKRKNKPVV